MPIAPIFARPIVTLDDAMALFAHLSAEDRLFHPEDSAATIVNLANGAMLFSDEEAAAIDDRMAEAYTLEWGDFECPCGYILETFPA